MKYILLLLLSMTLLSCEIKETCKTCDVLITKHNTLPVPSTKILCGDDLVNLKEYIYILDTKTWDTITTIKTICY